MTIDQLCQKWFYIRKHMRLLVRHLTLRRAANLVINQCEFFLRRERLASYPGFLKIDPSNRCQLRCPGCGQASDDFRAALPTKAFLTLADFKKIVDPLAPTTLAVTLSDLGEPFLNKHLVEIIEYAHSLNIGVTISTNLSIKFSDEYLERMVKSGLDKLVVALDGASSETYPVYRVGGKFELVTGNVTKLAAIKQQLGYKTPEIQWKFIEFPHNRHEISTVPALYKRWGFDSYLIDCDREDTRVLGGKKTRFARKEACFFPYSTMVVDVEGTVQPCCSYRFDTDWQLGNAYASDVRQIWNNATYRSLRKGFARTKYGRSMHPTCRACFGGGARPQSKTENLLVTITTLDTGLGQGTQPLEPTPVGRFARGR